MKLADRKGVFPDSLQGAEKRLESMADEIAQNGYQPKYNDTELQDLAQGNRISAERFQVRFMKRKYLWAEDNVRDLQDVNNLTGFLGPLMQGESGASIKYWSTTFDQMEDAGKSSQLICEKLGLDFKENEQYALVIIDTHKVNTLTNRTSVTATFDKVSGIANETFAESFPKNFTDTVMTKEFQDLYAEHHKKASQGYLEQEADQFGFSDYLATTGLNKETQNLLKRRMLMHRRIGNNQYYKGNGLTQNTGQSSPNQYGVVETLNLERKAIQLQQLQRANAIMVIPELDKALIVKKDQYAYEGLTADQLDKIRYKEIQKLAEPLRKKALGEIKKLENKKETALKQLDALKEKEPQKPRFLKALRMNGYLEKREQWSNEHNAIQERVWSISKQIDQHTTYAKPSVSSFYLSGAEKEASVLLEKKNPALVKKYRETKELVQKKRSEQIRSRLTKAKSKSKGMSR